MGWVCSSPFPFDCHVVGGNAVIAAVAVTVAGLIGAAGLVARVHPPPRSSSGPGALGESASAVPAWGSGLRLDRNILPSPFGAPVRQLPQVCLDR